MKKIKNTLLALLTLIFTVAVTIPTHAQDNTSPKAYKEYYNLLDSLVNGNPNDENNIGIDVYVSSDSSLLGWEDIEYACGLLTAQLVDFDNNGTKELFYMYLEDNSKYIYKVYGYDDKNNNLINLLSGSIGLSSHWSSRNSISLVKHNNRTYLKIYDGFYHGGDYSGEIKYDFITFDNNKMKSESMIFKYEPTEFEREQIINGDIDESEIYKYTYLSNDKEELIEASKADEILNQYSKEEVVCLAYDHGYFSDLDFSYYDYSSKLDFIAKLRDKSFETSFTNAQSILSEDDYKTIDKFKDVFIRFDKYDKLNYDKNELIDFIFNLYLREDNENYKYSDINHISGEKEADEDFTSSLPISTIQSVIYDLFGIYMDFKENDTFTNNFDDYEIVYKVEGDNLIRTGFYYTGDLSFERELINVYHIEDNYYFLDITEIRSIYDGVDYIKHSSIVEKLDNGNFNLLKTEDKTLEDSEVKSFIKSIKVEDEDTSKNDDDSKTVVKDNSSVKNNSESNNFNFIIVGIVVVVISIVAIIIKLKQNQ